MFQISRISEKFFDFLGAENNGKTALAARTFDRIYGLVSM
jgi:hypothetical protein